MKRSLVVWWMLGVVVASAVGVRCLITPAEADPAAAKATADFLAAAPGWVDVQGGTRRLSATTEGVVVEIAAVEGKMVAAGTTLLRLDAQSLQLEEQSNALELKRQQQQERSIGRKLLFALEERARVKDLVARQAEPADSLRQAEAEVEALKNQRQAAQLAIEGTRLQQRHLDLQARQHRLVAPSRGRLLRADAQVGESVSAGQPVLWFAPDTPLIVRAEIDENLVAQLKPGMTARVEAEAGDGRNYPATLLSIARAVGPVRALPEVRSAAKDDRVVECLLLLGDAPLLIGQRVIVRIGGAS